MRYKRLGKTSLLISELSFGSWVTFSERGTIPTHEFAYEVMKTAYDGGVNYFDNSEAYSYGEAEVIMGKAVKMGIENKVWAREDLILSTKLFFGCLPPEGSATYLPNRKRVNRVGLSRKHIIEGLKGSLKRMEVDYADIVFCHRFDPLADLEEVVRAFNFLIDQGLVFYWGTSEWSADQIREAMGIAERLGMVGPCCDQPQYHMFHRERVELEYARLYPKLGIASWSPLCFGILTGKYKDGIPEGSRLAQDMFKSSRESERTKERINTTEELRPIAKKLECTLAQLAIAWCIANKNVSTVITGASSVKQVKENLKAIEIVDKLTPDIMDDIEDILDNEPLPPSYISTPVNHRKVDPLRHVDI